MRQSLALDDALTFAARHPVGHLDESTRRRLLTALTSGPAGTLALRDARGALVLLATVVDVLADPETPAELVVLGAAPGLSSAVFAADVLAPARAFARAVGRRELHVSRPTFLGDADEVLERGGFTFLYETIAMRRAHARVDAPAADLPREWSWAPLDDARVEAAHAALVEIFRGAPSTSLPPLDAFRRGAFASRPGWHLLLDGEALAGLVRLSATGADGQVRILGVRAGYQGGGLGRLLLDHGLRVLADAGVDAVTLEVAASNERALALYRAFDFEVVERTPVFSTVL